MKNELESGKQMNGYVCFFGVVIIVVFLVLFAQSQTVGELVENPAYRQYLDRMRAGYAREKNLPSLPQQYIVEQRTGHPYIIQGAIVLLIGVATLIIGYMIPRDVPRAHD